MKPASSVRTSFTPTTFITHIVLAFRLVVVAESDSGTEVASSGGFAFPSAGMGCFLTILARMDALRTAA